MRQLTRRQRVSAIVLAVLALCFITLDLGGGSLRQAHAGVRGTLGSLYRGTDSVVGPARRWVAGVPDAGRDQGRIQALQHENAELRGKLNAHAVDRRVGTRVAALQRAADGSGHDVLPARVVAFGPGQGFDWTVTLDTGTNERRAHRPDRHQRRRTGRAGAARRFRQLGRTAGGRPGLRASALATPAAVRSASPPATATTG